MDHKQNNDDPYNSVNIKITNYSGGSLWKKNSL